jgi:hypothetical protein
VPVLQDVSCPGDYETGHYCVGMPSALVVGDEVLLYATNRMLTDAGPCPGRLLLARSTDGLHFGAAVTVFDHANVDVKRDRATGLFFMALGEVDGSTIYWSASADGVSWLPFDASRTIAANASLPAGGVNHNPGIAADPSGAFHGMTWIGYGSSWGTATWGHWNLFRSDVMLGPAGGATDCRGCVANSCDWGCQRGGAEHGVCAVPGSVDPGACCSCDSTPEPAQCEACAAGCVAACTAAGHGSGYCGIPGSTDPTACCSCPDP